METCIMCGKLIDTVTLENGLRDWHYDNGVDWCKECWEEHYKETLESSLERVEAIR